jgi:hypothetical protein
MTERYRPPLAATVLERDKAEAEAETPKRVRGRPFKPGNPGRPRGSKNRTTRLLEQLMANEGETLTRKVIDRALAGGAWKLAFPNRTSGALA